MKHPLSTALLISGALVFPMPSLADELSEDRVKELVLETILENPEIIMEAFAILQERDENTQAVSQADVLENQRELLERDPNAPVLGNPEGDVTVIEFFDYNCPYCKRAAAEVEGLIAADTNVRLVYREWPILGEGSVFAARAALASRNQDKYEEFHWALMDLKGRAEKVTVLRAAEEIGLDVEKLLADMSAPEIDEHIETSMRLTDALGFTGTPSFVIGEALVPGFVEQSQLESIVNETRKAAE